MTLPGLNADDILLGAAAVQEWRHIVGIIEITGNRLAFGDSLCDARFVKGEFVRPFFPV